MKGISGRWYVDPTLADDSEFPSAPGSPLYGHMDLLTVVMHELGHVQGFGDIDDDHDIMGGSLLPGIRRLPEANDLTMTAISGHALTAAPASSLPVSLLASIAAADGPEQS